MARERRIRCAGQAVLANPEVMDMDDTKGATGLAARRVRTDAIGHVLGTKLWARLEERSVPPSGGVFGDGGPNWT